MKALPQVNLTPEQIALVDGITKRLPVQPNITTSPSDRLTTASVYNVSVYDRAVDFVLYASPALLISLLFAGA